MQSLNSTQYPKLVPGVEHRSVLVSVKSSLQHTWSLLAHWPPFSGPKKSDARHKKKGTQVQAPEVVSDAGGSVLSTSLRITTDFE